MRDLIDRSLRLWHQCHRLEATRAELVEALSVIPALAAALEAAIAREAEAVYPTLSEAPDHRADGPAPAPPGGRDS
ncbi:MAG TPA: hypothetical protein VM599_05870 [Thermoanaerobaculia bacterium]|nr:hypothetical protein [Thermoanaerobaculia bacterium]